MFVHLVTVVPDPKILQVEIPPGIPSTGHRTLFRSAGSEAPYRDPSDVEVEIHVTNHPLFSRRGPHLYVNAYLTVMECLVGFNRSFITPDNRTVRLSRIEMSPPGTEFEFQGYGLPLYVVKNNKESERKKRNERKSKRNKKKKPKLLKEGDDDDEGGEGKEGKVERGSLVVVTRLVRESLFDLNDEQRIQLRSALKTKTKDQFQKERKRRTGSRKSKGDGDDEEKNESESGGEKSEERGEMEKEEMGKEEEEEEEENDAFYIVHLKELDQLLTGMGQFWVPKNISLKK